MDVAKMLEELRRDWVVKLASAADVVLGVPAAPWLLLLRRPDPQPGDAVLGYQGHLVDVVSRAWEGAPPDIEIDTDPS